MCDGWYVAAGSLGGASMWLLRSAGVLFGLLFLFVTFLQYRALRLSKGETGLRWLVAFALIVVSAYPASISGFAATLALKQVAYGRILALLIASTLFLWWLLFRERQKAYALKKEVDYLVRYVAIDSADDALIDRAKASPVIVAIPAWNESKAVIPVLERMPREIEGRAVMPVVIDDGSTDGTFEAVRDAGFHSIRSPFNRGQGSALRIGYDLAKRVGAEVVVTLDADGQHQPEEVGQVIHPILESDSDLVIGSRILGEGEGGSAFRTLGIYVYNTMINTLAGTKITDCSSGFKAFRVDALQRVDFRENQFQSAEVIITCHKHRLKISEVPITITGRTEGVSKKGNVISYGLSFCRTIWRSWWR